MTKFTFATDHEGFDNHIDKSVRGYSHLWGDILSLSPIDTPTPVTVYSYPFPK